MHFEEPVERHSYLWELVLLFMPEEHIKADGDADRCLHNDGIAFVHREPTLGLIVGFLLFFYALLLHQDPELFCHSVGTGL